MNKFKINKTGVIVIGITPNNPDVNAGRQRGDAIKKEGL
jgi:hypothetical protein